MKIIYLLVPLFIVSACESVAPENNIPLPDPNDNDPFSTLWFGYYQEDAVNNPEDPLNGLVYLNIPDDGTFAGQLFFSYAGCDDNFDAGQVEGTISGSNINGSWEGIVDGESVGGSYTGQRSSDDTMYSGSYTNDNGKQNFECDQDFHYYVASNGNWFLFRSDNDDAMEIIVEIIDKDASFTWSDIPNTAIYRFVIIDQDCLEEKQDLELCLVWGGDASFNSLEYDEGNGDIPATPLIKGNDYVINVIAIGNTRDVLATSSKQFRF